MAYFVFLKNFDNKEGSLYRIAENLSDLNNFGIFKDDYKIIEDTQENFNAFKFNKKNILKYSGETIIYEDNIPAIKSKSHAEFKIKLEKEIIKKFLQSNSNHSLFSRWNNYYTQLSNLNLDSITYPLNKSLEEYLNELGQPSFHILQLP